MTAALSFLASRLAVVAVVSGRPLAFLERHLVDDPTTTRIVLAGLYGLEPSRPGICDLPAEVLTLWTSRVEAAAVEAAGAIPEGAELERKGLGLAVHWRRSPAIGAATTALLGRIAADHGLEVRQGRLVLELVPPLPVDKGTVVTALASGLDAGCFLGDDIGDLAGFAALTALAARPGRSLVPLRLAISSGEAPTALTEKADIVLDGPPSALSFLEELSARLGRPTPGLP